MRTLRQHSIKYNFVMNILLTSSTIIFPLLTFPYVSRVLNPYGTGKVAFASSVVTYFSMIAQLGIPTYGIRESAKLRDDKKELTCFVQEILIINVITCSIVYILFLYVLFNVPRLNEDKVLLFIMSSTIVFNTIGLEWLYKGLEQYGYITGRTIFLKILALIGMFAFVNSNDDIVAYGALTILANVGSNIFNFIHSRKYVDYGKVEVRNLRRHLKPIFIFFSMSIATTVYTNLDNLMLGFLRDDVEVGYYNAAIKIKSALVSFVASLGTVLLPKASHFISQKQEKQFDIIARKSLSFTILLAIPMVLFFSMFSEQCILIIAGSEYIYSISTLCILMPTILLIGLTNVIGMQILIPLGREKIVLYSVAAGAVIDFIINLIMIPAHGTLGAAWGTTIAELTVFIIQWWNYREKLNSMFRSIEVWKILIALIAGGMSSFWIRFLSINNIFILLFSAFIFGGIYLVILYLLKESLIYQLIQEFLLKFSKRQI